MVPEDFDARAQSYEAAKETQSMLKRASFPLPFSEQYLPIV
jgi:hypothetical protein